MLAALTATILTAGCVHSEITLPNDNISVSISHEKAILPHWNLYYGDYHVTYKVTNNGNITEKSVWVVLNMTNRDMSDEFDRKEIHITDLKSGETRTGKVTFTEYHYMIGSRFFGWAENRELIRVL